MKTRCQDIHTDRIAERNHPIATPAILEDWSWRLSVACGFHLSKEPFRNNLYICPAFVNAFRADGSLHT